MNDAVRVKSIARVIAGQSPPSDEVTPLLDGLPFIQGNAEFGTPSPRPIWQSGSAPKRAAAGDLLLSVRAPVGALNIAREPLGIGRGVAAVRARDPRFQRWLFWAIEASRDELISRAAGSTFQAVSSSDIGEIRVRIPRAPNRVADYLDHETTEIDAFVADLERMKSLTAEHLQSFLALIAIEWGTGSEKIHWHYRVRNGLTPKVDDEQFWIDGDIPWVNSSVVHRELVTAPSRFVTKAALRKLGLPLIPRGSLLVGLTGEGKTRGATTRLGIDTTISQHVAALTRRPGSMLTEDFLQLALTASYEDLRTRSSGNGGTKGAITCELLQQYRVPILADAAQRAFVRRWTGVREAASAMSADIDAAIALAKERRAALITAAVAGRIDVTAERPSAVKGIERAIEGSQ